MMCRYTMLTILVGMVAFPGIATPAAAAGASCAGMADRRIEAAAMALPTAGAVITSADERETASQSRYCRLAGRIDPVDPVAPPILFEVDLPSAWNGKYLQYGGGGLNGTLSPAIVPLRDSPPGKTPLELGYATASTDGGHPAAKPAIQIFALNREALVNHAYGAYKKTSDLARALITAYYGRAPRLAYFFGGSEGGREALMFAQRFPKDFNGIVAVVPVINWTGIQLATYDHWQLDRAGGWMGHDKLVLWQKTALAACDAADGLSDGVIADFAACRETPGLDKLACPAGVDNDTCLTRPHLALIAAVEHPRRYKFALMNGETDYPPFAVGGEAQPGGTVPWIIEPQQPTPDDKAFGRYAAGDVRYFFVRDPNFSAPFDEAAYRDRVMDVSRLMDMTDPDLTAFYRAGGKLILRSNTADYVQAPRAVMRYYTDVVQRMGKAKAARFVRLFMAPGLNHNGAGVRGDGLPIPDKVDLLTALDTWVSTAAPPGALTLTSYDAAGAPKTSWPLCAYPAYPRYVNGPDTMAASFRCAEAVAPRADR